MKKIISLFQRNYDGDRLVRNEVVPGAEWVIAGEGVATRKWDGTCCLVRDGKLFKRYEVKAGGKAPANFEAASEVDPVTGKQQGWVPVGDGPEDRWHREAFARDNAFATVQGGTYELCGPHVQGNPERWDVDVLCQHGVLVVDDVPRDFDGIREYLRTHDIEGIVWHHDDGRMVKIKAKDFGLKRCKTSTTPA
jgi:hypothetical protein